MGPKAASKIVARVALAAGGRVQEGFNWAYRFSSALLGPTGSGSAYD
jgi:hypothetical protein